MAQPRSWLEEVIDALHELGDQAHYNKIFQRIQDRGIMNFEENKTWTAAVRSTIERSSSDSKAFTGKEDIFYSAQGKGKGVWGIREPYRPRENRPMTKDVLDKKYRIDEHRAKALSDAQLKKKALSKETKHPKSRIASTNTYERNAFVSEYAKRRAKGVCQLCAKEAPFMDKAGSPYLETHHVVWLSKGGGDTIDNTVALCPNCHRKMHVLNRKEDREALLSAAKSGESHPHVRRLVT
ncbi:HNH endonuclease [Oscillibacter hominis]|uniref:HNH endonuclease n=1 Tax=Oscillibacter hominis TaxID=2763056 RepID=A0A7G9B4R5_9FIRM|nr:HNH endonuclease [Oscillibacter hominis]QNL44546.1 HNH endonuclease [Oscillibacter hominis]